jgi:hypothetical protein
VSSRKQADYLSIGIAGIEKQFKNQSINYTALSGGLQSTHTAYIWMTGALSRSPLICRRSAGERFTA